MDANVRESRRLLPTLGGTKRAAVNFSILRSYAKQKRTLGSERPEGVPVEHFAEQCEAKAHARE